MAEKLKKKNGGARPGAGRKPKLKDDARELFYATVDQRWTKIVALIDYYLQKKDKDILKMIIEQRIGKPPQPLVGGGEGSAPILIKWQQ